MTMTTPARSAQTGQADRHRSIEDAFPAGGVPGFGKSRPLSALVDDWEHIHGGVEIWQQPHHEGDH